MRQPILLTLLLAASAHAATKYVTTTCTSTSTTTITHISASSTQIFTSAFPVVETPAAVSSAPSSTIVVPLSSSAPSAGSSLVYTSEAAPFPTAAGTGAPAPVGTGSGSASGTGAPISPATPFRGAAPRNTGSLFGGVVVIGAVALALC
ncbi:hypothetical protein BDR22DRAFT_382849 [Usnea florida]